MEFKVKGKGVSVDMDRRSSLLESGVLPDDLADGKVPDDVVKAETARERVGMGGTPRRKEVDIAQPGEGGEESSQPEEGEDDETKWEK